MKIIDCIQGSDEWIDARLGIVTASELDALISPLWKARTGEGVKTYMAKKLAEKWRGMPITTFHGGAMEQGSMREDEARSWYELDQNVSIKQVGFILNDEGTMGCSPDGLLDDCGIEIKCPEPHTHVRWLLDEVLPADHRAQVYGGMLVTGLPRWKFLSYCRGFPPLLLTIESDPKVLDAIREAHAEFVRMFEQAWGIMETHNGGPPVRFTPEVAAAFDDPTSGF